MVAVYGMLILLTLLFMVFAIDDGWNQGKVISKIFSRSPSNKMEKRREKVLKKVEEKKIPYNPRKKSQVTNWQGIVDLLSQNHNDPRETIKSYFKENIGNGKSAFVGPVEKEMGITSINVNYDTLVIKFYFQNGVWRWTERKV